MFNNELYEIISQDKTLMMGFQGIRPADQLPKSLQCDQSLIFNASDSDENGTHWLCLYQNSDSELEMFDSFGNPPSFFNLQDKLPYSRTIVYNMKQLQGVKSSVCGVYCMQYLFYKSRGYPTCKIVNDLYSVDLNQNDRNTIDYIKRLYNYI